MSYRTLYLCAGVITHPTQLLARLVLCALHSVTGDPDWTDYQLVFSLSLLLSPLSNEKKKKEKSADTPHKAQLMSGRLTTVPFSHSSSISTALVIHHDKNESQSQLLIWVAWTDLCFVVWSVELTRIMLEYTSLRKYTTPQLLCVLEYRFYLCAAKNTFKSHLNRC